MRLLKMFFVLMIAAMAIGLSSCAKEEVPPSAVDAAASEIIYAHSGGEREDDPDEDCRCEFRILSVSNLPSAGSTNDWVFATWDGSMPDQEVQFDGDEYKDPNTGDFSGSYPSPYWDIPGGAGAVTFAFIDAQGVLASNATIRVQIDCYSQNDNGTEALATTTFYTFIFSDATEVPGGGAFTLPSITTSCLSQIGL